MVSEELFDLLREQMKEVHSKFPDLLLEQGGEGRFRIRGQVQFQATHNGQEIQADYPVELIIPDNYPQEAPKAKVLDGKVPANFHTFSDGTLCLGAPLAVKIKFAKHPTLRSFIELQLVPYLFSYSYRQKFGEMPYGELRHGVPGKLDYYKDLFGVEGNQAALVLLSFLAADNYKGHQICPCGRGPKIRHCHGPQLSEIKFHAGTDVCLFIRDFVELYNYLIENDSATKYPLVLGKLAKSCLEKYRKLNRDSKPQPIKPVTIDQST